MNEERKALIGIAVSTVIAIGMAAAGSANGRTIGGIAVFALCAVLAFLVNWLAFIPAYLRQTERFFDITGTATYLAMVACAVVWGSRSPRAALLGVLVGIWTLRLGIFLFRRISQDGSDGRFDELKPNPVRFFSTWTIQGLWCLMTFSCALAAMTSVRSVPLDALSVVGVGVWCLGFGIEAISDHQKRVFRADPANHGRFITTGLWSWSRHPNYFGEIVLWFAVALIALPVLRGWQYVTLVSPVFVYLLLTRISGIPLLEARAKKRWGKDEAFRQYTDSTPVLIPRPPR